MNRVLLLILSVIFTGCAITPIGCDEAIPIAMQELEKRHVPLQVPYEAQSSPGKPIEELGTVKYVWAVTFSTPDSKKPLYLVCVNQYNRNIELFRDYRHLGQETR